jgi:hypothetical protein
LILFSLLLDLWKLDTSRVWSLVLFFLSSVFWSYLIWSISIVLNNIICC